VKHSSDFIRLSQWLFDLLVPHELQPFSNEQLRPQLHQGTVRNLEKSSELVLATSSFTLCNSKEHSLHNGVSVQSGCISLL
jgi:hypothetical protein